MQRITNGPSPWGRWEKARKLSHYRQCHTIQSICLNNHQCQRMPRLQVNPGKTDRSDEGRGKRSKTIDLQNTNRSSPWVYIQSVLYYLSDNSFDLVCFMYENFHVIFKQFFSTHLLWLIFKSLLPIFNGFVK